MTRARGSVLLLIVAILAGVAPGRADLIATGFEAPTYHVGSIHNQDGWLSPGPNDQMVTRQADPTLGLQSFRMSNANATSNYTNQTLSKPTLNETGEALAANNGFSGGVRVRRFDAQWVFGSSTEVWQPGLSVGIAPERGDGQPMSLIRLIDQPGGMQVEFTEYRSGLRAPGCSNTNFNVSTVVQGLGRLRTHTIRLVLNFLDGVRNDSVLLYVDDVLRFTGTTWEDVYRECGGFPTRTVDSLNFNTVGSSCTACDGRGFIFDKLEIRAVGVVVSPQNLTITEGGAPGTYTVRLETPPLDFVRVIPAPGPGVTVTPIEHVFTAADFNVPKTFTVTTTNDNIPEPPATVTIGHNVASFDGHFDGVPVDSVTVTVNDDDAPFILTETGGNTIVAEQGPTSDSYTFRLFTPPTDNVTITAAFDAQVTVTPAFRTFTPVNWNLPQQFTVTAVDDAVDETDPHFSTITHTAASTDPNYGGQPVPSVNVTIQDNDPVPPPVPAPIITNCPAGVLDTTNYTFTGTTQVNTAIEVYINGNVAGGVLPDPFGNWTINVTFPGNGTWVFTARATDLAGNRSPFSAPCNVTINADLTPPPVPTIATPAQNAVTPRTVTVSGNAFGDTVELRLFDAGVLIATLLTGPGPWSTVYTFPSGVHTLTARALDAVGNISAPSPVRTFTADGEPPVVSMDSPPLTVFIQLVLPFQPWNLQGTASDAHSGVVRMEVTYDNLITGESQTEPIICTCPSAPGALVFWETHPALIPGLYRVTVRAFDMLNNMGRTTRSVLYVA